MNWVGGARSRIEKKNDKKTQKLFFERKRQEKKLGQTLNTINPTSTRKGFQLSQDLLSFHTVMKAHDKRKSARTDPLKCPKLKHVEINELTPCRIQHNTNSLSTSPAAKSSIEFHRVSDEKPKHIYKKTQ